MPRLARWAALPPRLIVGYGLVAHGWTKLANGPAHFVEIVRALGVPAAELGDAVADLAAAIVESPAPAVRAITALMDSAHDNSADEQLAAERAAQITLLAGLVRNGPPASSR